MKLKPYYDIADIKYKRLHHCSGKPIFEETLLRLID